MKSDNEQISLLICKQLIGTITADEQQTLDEWRRQSPCNEAAYQRLHDQERLQVEYHRRQLSDYHRPLDDMKRRLGIRQRPLYLRYMAAAAIILLIVGAVVWWQQPSLTGPAEQLTASTDEIRPGTMQATLTLANGEQIELKNDTLFPRPVSPSNRRQSVVAEASVATLTTPRGGEFRIVLEDGTEVWLNADSRLSYPEVFEGSERRVALEGEAYFRVAKNSERPFIVSSGKQEVHVYGTEFNVHAYSDEPDVYTTLVEGSIALRLTGDSDQSREFLLTPGHQTKFDTLHTTFNVREVDTEVVTSWRKGVFVFEDQTMEQIMRTLSRWYDFDYEFLDNKTAQTVIMGSIPRYGSFDEVCDIFHKLGGVRMRQQGRKVIISAQ